MNTLMLIYGALMALGQLQQLNVKPNEQEWAAFKLQHGKIYANEQEEMMRKLVFTLNKHNIDKFNAEESAKLGYFEKVNSRSDWTAQEFARLTRSDRRLIELRRENSPKAQKFLDNLLSVELGVLPDEVDWRKAGNRVSRVKDQGGCGSSWAFAAVDALEGQEVVRIANKTTLTELSVQNAQDCNLYGNCIQEAGLEDVFTYSSYFGIDDEKSYPNTWNEQLLSCQFQEDKVVIKSAGSAQTRMHDEEQLKRVVATYGPVAATIIDPGNKLRNYSLGVFFNPLCPKFTGVGWHSVLIIGYGTDPKEGDYWLIKNSLGLSWGMRGIAKIARNKNDHCQIATIATIPIF